MTWVSLVCLLALSSCAFGHYGGDYRARLLTGGANLAYEQTVNAQLSRPVLTSATYTQPQLATYAAAPATTTIIQKEQILPAQTATYTTSYGAEMPKQAFLQTEWQKPAVAQNEWQKPALIQTEWQKPALVQAEWQKPALVQTEWQKPALVQTEQTLVAQRVLPQTASYAGYTAPQKMLEQAKVEVIKTEWDIMCQGQRVETVFPLDNGRRFIVCIDEGKGVEQWCPKGLFYRSETRRCERKLGALENPCALQPCFNGGQCLSTELTSYQCQCPAGFEGKNCELDARVCQTQNPCGQAAGSRCQSFRLGAALQHVCICQHETGYGLSCQQAHQNPCQGFDGPQRLLHTDKGFLMCDGERFFVESCPGGTKWDDSQKACVWPDMVGLVTMVQPERMISSEFGQQRVSMISSPAPAAKLLEQPALTSYTELAKPEQLTTVTKVTKLEQPLNQYTHITKQIDQPIMTSYTPQIQQRLIAQPQVAVKQLEMYQTRPQYASPY